MIQCTRCGESKPASEFYADRKCRARGGFQYHCKVCVKAERQQYYDANSSRVVERVRQYAKMHRDSTRAHSAKQRANQSLEEKQAWAKLNHEVVAGRVAVPAACELCGSESKLFAHHHNGYSPENALDVVWVCVPCHHALHGRGPTFRRLAEAKGSPRIDWETVIFAQKAGRE